MDFQPTMHYFLNVEYTNRWIGRGDTILRPARSLRCCYYLILCRSSDSETNLDYDNVSKNIIIEVEKRKSVYPYYQRKPQLTWTL